MDNIQKVKIGRGPAQSITTIKGRRMSYTGVWSLSMVDDINGIFYSVGCMVPGELSMFSSAMAAMNWSTSDYVLELEAVADDGDIPVNSILMDELKVILQKVEDGEISAVNVYGDEASREYVHEIIAFLQPRLDYIPTNLEGRVATKVDIEASMRAREIPPLPRA